MFGNKLGKAVFRVDSIISRIVQPIIHGLCALTGRSNFGIARFFMYTYIVCQLVWLVDDFSHHSILGKAGNLFLIAYNVRIVEFGRKSITMLEKRVENDDGTMGLSAIDYLAIVSVRVFGLPVAVWCFIVSDYSDAISFLAGILCLYSLTIRRPRRRSVVAKMLSRLSLRVPSPVAQ